MLKHSNWLKKAFAMLVFGFVIYWGYIYFSLSDSCRNFEKIIEDGDYLPIVKQKLGIYLDEPGIEGKYSMDFKMISKQITSLELLSPSSPKLELDWSKLDIPKKQTFLKVYKVSKMVDGKEKFFISEFGIGAGRNFLMFNNDNGSDISAFVECGVYKGG